VTLELAHGGLADLPAVMTVMEAAFEPRFGEAWTAAQCAGLLPMPGVWLTVARAQGAPVGFSLARVVAGEAELLLLAVHPDARSRGIGKSLLDHFFATASARGAERLHLEVRDGNDALKLYNASGFQVVGRRRGYYSGRDGSNYDALSLARPTNTLASDGGRAV
jgi:ribosomal-protein-alanine N-acetyltransferase